MIWWPKLRGFKEFGGLAQDTTLIILRLGYLHIWPSKRRYGHKMNTTFRQLTRWVGVDGPWAALRWLLGSWFFGTVTCDLDILLYPHLHLRHLRLMHCTRIVTFTPCCASAFFAAVVFPFCLKAPCVIWVNLFKCLVLLSFLYSYFMGSMDRW